MRRAPAEAFPAVKQNIVNKKEPQALFDDRWKR
jgi:hypothetical protein